MTRAGREPTEDAKRRIVAACREAGLKVVSARSYLRDDERDLVTHVCASAPERPFEEVSISMRTTVTLTGDWTRVLNIRCAACERDSDPTICLFLSGRRVPRPALAVRLVEGLERAFVRKGSRLDTAFFAPPDR
jgi:hypothetical protein